VVLLSSRPGLDPAAAPCSAREGFHTYAAPLLPKVRGQFAEFLNQGSLVRLGLLDQPTCVGLRYGRRWVSLADLSWLCRCLALGRGLPRGLGIASRSSTEGICLPRLPTGLHGARLAAATPPQHSALVKRRLTVSEYQPIVHRLRHSATP
jgi:hypothetical protein